MSVLEPQQQFAEWYTNVEAAIFAKAQHIKLLICDVDGVFSDGRIYLGNDGEELKAFHTRDGFGVKALLQHGVKVAVITGRNSQIVLQRMQALGVEDIIQGQEHKHEGYQALQQKYALQPSQIACIGDDVPDLALLGPAGLSVAPADAHPMLRQAADYVTQQPGGFGAVREVSDLILLSQNGIQRSGGLSI